MIDIREIKQAEAVESFDERGILHCCPRFGKIKTCYDIFRREGAKRVLVVVPRNDIRQGWIDDASKWGGPEELIFSTTASLKKYLDIEIDYLALDEIQEYSNNQLDVADKLVRKFPTIGLSGGMTKTTERNIEERTGLTTCFKYTIDEAVRDGILVDYQIFIHSTPLDNKTIYKQTKKGRYYTEKNWFDALEYIPPKNLSDVRRINVIQNSISKRALTKELISKYRNDRVLIFCGTIETANSLGVPVYHSGDKNEQIFTDFCNGIGDKLATIKMLEAGITILPIDRGIVNYTTGSPESCCQKVGRFLCQEINYPDKKASIHIVSSTEPFETERIKTSLSFFDKSKILYL